MKTRWVRFAVALLVLLGIGLSISGAARAQSDEVPLAWSVPEGVTFETLASGEGRTFRFHIDAMHLHRIAVGCGQVTGEIFGMEQILWVEYGQVDVRDWDSGEVIATLSAGDAFGPTEDETSFFLASPKGRNASVYHFSAGGAGEIGDELPDLTYETTDCGSGATNPMPAEPATVTTLFASDRVGDTMPVGEATFYVGLLTVEPGAALGRNERTTDEPAYTAWGSGLIVPLIGGFGGGQAGLAGAAGPEVGPDQVGWMYREGPIALENLGPIPTTALLFGAVSSGGPIFMGHHTAD